MAKAYKELPIQSLLNKEGKKYDYIDCFDAVLMAPENQFNALEIGKAVFQSRPKWIGTLFALSTD